MITINHVLSNDADSRIMSDILKYFRRYASSRFSYAITKEPVNALIRHYHRPNLENMLIAPCVVTVHHDLKETDKWLLFEKFENQYRQANMVVCLNHSQKKFLADVGINHTIVIPHGYNSDFLRPVPRRYDGSRRIVVGIFSKRYPRKVKGEAYLYELVKRLSPEHFEFLLVGRERRIDAKYLRERGFFVRSYDALPYSTLCSAYASIDILLVTSKFEGGPACIPEAIATSTPIISSPVGMSLDYIKHGENGFLLSMQPDDDVELINSLFQEDGQKLNIMFENAMRMTRLAIQWSEVIARYEQLYQRIIRDIYADGEMA